MPTLERIKNAIGRGLGTLSNLPKRPARSGFDLEAAVQALIDNPNISNDDFAVIANVPTMGNGQHHPRAVQLRRAQALKEVQRRQQLQGQQRNSPSEASSQSTATPAAPAANEDPDVADILDRVAFDVPAHAAFLNHLKNGWRIVGPVAFVVFTAWEVYYYMQHFLGDVDLPSKILLWGITLLIEIPFMIATFDQAERKRVRAEKKAMGVPFRDADTLPSIAGWSFLALVNVTGQVAFLLYITHLGDNPFDLRNPGVAGLWLFVCVRVAGVIMGDSYTAFFLRPDETSIERTIRAETAKGKGKVAIKENRAELKRIDAESDAKVRRIEIAIRKEERDASFMEQWNDMNMKQTLARQQHFLRQELQNYHIEELPASTEEQREPDTDQLQGL